MYNIVWFHLILFLSIQLFLNHKDHLHYNGLNKQNCQHLLYFSDKVLYINPHQSHHVFFIQFFCISFKSIYFKWMKIIILLLICISRVDIKFSTYFVNQKFGSNNLIFLKSFIVFSSNINFLLSKNVICLYNFLMTHYSLSIFNLYHEIRIWCKRSLNFWNWW